MQNSGRFLLAVTLMIAVIVLSYVLFPPARPQPRSAAVADTVSVDTTAVTGTPAAAGPAQPVAAPQSAGAVDTIVVQTPLYRFGFSTRGAALVSAQLLQYEDIRRSTEANPQPVQLAPVWPRGFLSHRFRIAGEIVDAATLSYVPSQTADIVLGEGDNPASLRFTASDAAGRQYEITYTFSPANYLVDVSARVLGSPDVSQVLIDFGPTLASNEANIEEDRRALGYVFNSREDGIRSVPFRAIREQRVEEGPLSWVALKNKYFAFAALPGLTGAGNELGFGGLVASPNVAGRYTKDLTATLPTTQQVGTYRFYLGPQEYDRLDAIGLRNVNPYGWTFVRPIIRPIGDAFTWILLSTHRATGLAYGWVLIFFGFAVRLALWPLNAKAMRSSMKSMELQPRIKEIQTRYQKDPQRLQQEMLKLYREEGFNPLGGCLPLLIPMPVLLTLFFVLRDTIEFRGVPFLWLPDLSRADPLYILPILLGVTMFIQQFLSMRTSPANPQAKAMLWFMPVFMVVIFLNFASGLNLYYAAQNVASFPQQLMMIRERREYMSRKRK